MTKYDAIIIGGGHNGLTTASLLAKQMKKVLVLERRNILGGVAASEEFHPGYRTAGLLHDTGSVRSDVIEKLSLRKFGLRTSGRRAPVALLADDGTVLTLHADPEQSARAIKRSSHQDAAAYLAYRSFLDSIAGWMSKLLNEPQPDLRNVRFRDLRKVLGASVGLRRLGKETMLEVLKVLPMSVADFLNERFETGFLKAGMALPAIFGSFNGPWSSYTTLNLLLWECTSREQIIGGPVELVRALEKAAKNGGAEIQTGAGVTRILLDGSGRVEGVSLNNGERIEARIVAASCTPQETFLNLLTSSEIGLKLESEITHVRSRGTVAKMNLALNKPLRWKGDAGDKVEFARTGNSFDEMEKAFDAIKYRRVSERPVLDIHVPTVSNPTLAPEGHEVVSVLSHFAPYELDGGWTESARRELGDRIVKVLSQHTVDLERSIVGREVMTPRDIEDRYGLTGGNLFHGEHAVDQLIGRPVPSCAGYSTPIPGLFLCGSGSHPGGGITCAPGGLASRAILAASGLR